ncbi:helix-turn-helix domain-containing protein [Streptomyces yaizuensis]|uniref:Helix-turn-helix domain-containing protein n=1 Tax=Streptomyces yaizuensis TaxID=2989713 RepID=A0AA86IWX4_9ACTN|nr:helix-turn-helix transcriptional regulator [Streptomyces sp. YSPA8]BDT39553.1 helix-turn-helix domain-containing protein [Streptomyces sp. YSPA8]
MHAANTKGAVGENVGTLRRTLGWTQSKLAHRANVSLSLLTKIEIGDRACTPATAAALASALSVPLPVLYGTPQVNTDSAEQITALRSAIRRYDQPEDMPADAHQLDRDIRNACDLRAHTKYQDLLAVLPDLISRTTAHAHHAQDPEAWMRLIEVYGCAYTLAGRLGHPDLAEVVVARQEWAASRTWLPVGTAVADWGKAGAYQSAGDYAGGMAVVEQAISKMTTGPQAGGDSPASLVALGSLHLRGVVMASRARDARATEDHARYARRLANRLGTADKLIHNLTFGTGNTALHELAAWVELDKPRKAAKMAAEIGDAELPGLTPTRVGHFHIDSARAHLAAGDREAALQSLQRGREIAPEMLRVHPMSRETVRVLLSLHFRSNASLTSLAKWAGIGR